MSRSLQPYKIISNNCHSRCNVNRSRRLVTKIHFGVHTNPAKSGCLALASPACGSRRLIYWRVRGDTNA